MPFRIVSAPSFFVGLASATCWRREHPEMDFWSVRPDDSGNRGRVKTGENQDQATRSIDTTQALPSHVNRCGFCAMVSDAAAPKVTLNQRSKSQSRPIKSSRPQRRRCLLSVIAGPRNHSIRGLRRDRHRTAL
jgi:hypothetical protein